MNYFTESLLEKLKGVFMEFFNSAVSKGLAKPELQKRTIFYKQRRGYTSPETPLWATGRFKEDTDLVAAGDNRAAFVTKTNLNPNWPALKDRKNSLLQHGKEQVKAAIKEEARKQIVQSIKNALGGNP